MSRKRGKPSSSTASIEPYFVKKWKSVDSTATLKETDGEQERIELAHIDRSKPLQTSDSPQPLPNDVGAFVGSTISAEKRYELLNNHWMPVAYYKFPAVVQQSGHNRSFQCSWLQTWDFLVYSPSQQGVYCIYCALFGPENVRTQELLRLVTEPLRRFKDARRDFEKHAGQDYHNASRERAHEFLARFTEKDKDILNLLDFSRQHQVKENRTKLRSIVETIMFCGQQELALRGHRDHGPLKMERRQHNDGIFRALLKVRVDAGDVKVPRQLDTANANATYLSWQTQNENINACSTIIVQKLVEEVKAAKFYSLLLDDTTDVAAREL